MPGRDLRCVSQRLLTQAPGLAPIPQQLSESPLSHGDQSTAPDRTRPMTSEVMAAAPKHGKLIPVRESTRLGTEKSRYDKGDPAMNMNPRPGLLVFSATLLVFATWTGVIVAQHGYTGFLILAAREPWGGQMFVDLVIALLLFTTWMRADAARESLPFWPYLVAILTTGSIGALAYLVHRSLRRLRTGAEMAAAA